MLGKHVQNFCCDDISLVENYKAAVNDKTQTWDLHHRLETDFGLSKDELIEQNKYFNVPASELIFMTHAEHIRLHQTERMKDPTRRQRISDEQNRLCEDPEERKRRSEANKRRYEDPKERQKTSEANKRRYEDPKERQKSSEAMKRRYEDPKAHQKTSEALNRPEVKVKMRERNKNRRWMNNCITCVFLKTQEEIEHYHELGYTFGRIYKRK